MSCCSLMYTSWPVVLLYCASRAPVAAKAQHDPQEPWFFTYSNRICYVGLSPYSTTGIFFSNTLHYSLPNVFLLKKVELATIVANSTCCKQADLFVTGILSCERGCSECTWVTQPFSLQSRLDGRSTLRSKCISPLLHISSSSSESIDGK